MATLTVIKPGHTEANMGAGASAASGGDAVPNDGVTMVRFVNTSSQITATISSKETCSQGSTHNVEVVIPATTGDVVVGPFEKTRFDNESEQFEITYSGVTGLTVWAISAGG
jgi:hypothetical protein